MSAIDLAREIVAYNEFKPKPYLNCADCGGTGVVILENGHNGDEFESPCECRMRNRPTYSTEDEDLLQLAKAYLASVILINEAGMDKIMDLIANPPKPTKKLVDAIRRHKDLGHRFSKTKKGGPCLRCGTQAAYCRGPCDPGSKREVAAIIARRKTK